MEFRVWAVLANEEDGRKFMGEVVEKYPVSPQGVEDDVPIYNPSAGTVLVAFRVTTDRESEDEYDDRLYSALGKDEEQLTEGERTLLQRSYASEDAKEVVETLTAILKRGRIKCYALVVNERQGQCEFSVATPTKDRFKVMEEHS